MLSANQLINYCIQAIEHPYFYGTYGQKATKQLYNSKKKQYPKYYNWNYKNSFTGQRVFDCVGLIKGAIWSDGDFNKTPKYAKATDLSADGMFNKCTKKGSIKNIPEIVGLLVHCSGHIGVYVGNGYVIEARGHEYGVQKNKLKDRHFTEYGYCPYIEYTAPVTIKPPVKPSVNIKYFKKCKSSYSSIVDALKSIGEPSNYMYRKKIAIKNGIKNYCGSAAQNVKMLNKLKKGILIKP